MKQQKGLSFPFRYGANGGLIKSSYEPNQPQRINESIEQILRTRKGERINNPEMGSNIHHYLFENGDDISTLALIQDEVETCLAEQEPRIEVKEVLVYPHETSEGMNILVEISYVIIQFETESNTIISFENIEGESDIIDL